MVLRLKPMGKPTTYQNQVLDRTKVLHGPRTQTYGKTNYVTNLSFGRTNVLHGPWTQTYGDGSNSPLACPNVEFH